jgi:hypothetical protein
MKAPERTPAFEPFVSAEEAARSLAVPRRFLLSLARKGIRGSYPIGGGDFRKRWIFKKSELAEAINPQLRMPPVSQALHYADRRRSSLK